jgi:hypothetical protein
MPIEQPSLVSEVSANFSGYKVPRAYVSILSFLDRSRYFFFQVASQLGLGKSKKKI